MLSAEKLIEPFHLPHGQHVVLAVSGGVDSMVLMHLLSGLNPARLQLIVATFDHQLREASGQEQAAVVAAANQLGLPVKTGRWPQAEHPVSGLEAAARTARYAFLKQVAAAAATPFIMTAHQADDQLETILFRLARSGQVPAMVGMTPVRSFGPVTLLRPLLAVPKATLIAYARENGITYFNDESNQDVRFARNRLRHDALPALKAVNAGALSHAGQFSRNLSAVLTLADRQIAGMLPDAGQEVLDWHPYTGESAGVQRLLLQAALARWQVYLSPKTATQVLSALAAAKGAKAFAVSGGRTLSAAYGALSLVPAVAAKVLPIELVDRDCWYQVGDLALGRFADLPAHAQRLAVVPDRPLVIRTRQPHDEVRLADGHHQLLRRFFINQKVPRTARASRLVAAVDDQLYWVQGIAPRQLFAGSQTDILQTVLALKSETKDEATDE